MLAPKDRNTWPKIWNKCLKSWSKTDNHIKIWYDEEIYEFIKNYDSRFFDILKTLPKIYTIDFVRYLILEKLGGAYFDLDVELLLDFTPQIDENKIYIVEAFAGDEDVQNSIMISPPHPFWTGICSYVRNEIYKNYEKIMENPFDEPDNDIPGTRVRRMTGPIALSSYLKKSDEKITMLPNLCFNESEIGFTKHHGTGRWPSGIVGDYQKDN